MKLILCVSGKLRKSPELELFNNYLAKTKKIGKLIHLSSITVLEYEGTKFVRQIKYFDHLKSGSYRSYRVLLDESGKNFSSVAFAEKLRSHRDSGTSEFVFFIGAAEGVPVKLSENFDEKLSFGKMVWPHFLARVMLMEQIYRASTILAGLPYHKI